MYTYVYSTCNMNTDYIIKNVHIYMYIYILNVFRQSQYAYALPMEHKANI